MFIIHMPTAFKVGDTADCRINGEAQRLTWRDENTLVIEPDDAHMIVSRVTDGELICFMCGDTGKSRADYDVDHLSDGGVIVSERERE